jgi:hypothetical protein
MARFLGAVAVAASIAKGNYTERQPRLAFVAAIARNEFTIARLNHSRFPPTICLIDGSGEPRA